MGIIIEQHRFRWSDYFLCKGDHFDYFWQEFLSIKRNLLFIIGYGFDHRMCDCAKAILDFPGEGTRDAIVIDFDEGPNSPSHQYGEQREKNFTSLKKLFQDRGDISVRKIEMLSEDGRRAGGRRIVNEFNQIDEFNQYTDVIVDISALPSGLYFPLISKLLTLFNQNKQTQNLSNLHVVVAHSSAYDKKIKEIGIDEEASFLHGFAAASFEREATLEQPRIWIPILGKGQNIQLEKIYELVHPDEICPLLPSPAKNPREADDLIYEYRALLFDQLRVEPQNFIYASETNPFEVYRQIMKTIKHYSQALDPLGGCKAVVSAVSSKLLSMGALLAACELTQLSNTNNHIAVGVGHVDTHGYEIEDGPSEDVETDLYSLWLYGEYHV